MNLSFVSWKSAIYASAILLAVFLTCAVQPASSRPAAADRGLPEPVDDRATVAGLDKEYQAAVKINDAETMDRILADDFVLVTGSGKSYSKRDLIDEARSGRIKYTHQEDTERMVRVWGNTAIVTAELWEEGTDSGKPFDYHVWFSDAYIRTQGNWRYVFGQSSLPLTSGDRQ